MPGATAKASRRVASKLSAHEQRVIGGPLSLRQLLQREIAGLRRRRCSLWNDFEPRDKHDKSHLGTVDVHCRGRRLVVLERLLQRGQHHLRIVPAKHAPRFVEVGLELCLLGCEPRPLGGKLPLGGVLTLAAWHQLAQIS